MQIPKKSVSNSMAMSMAEDYRGIISARAFNMIIGLCLFYGFGVNALMVKFCYPMMETMNPIVFLIGYFISCFAGIALYKNSDNPVVSFLGYNLVVLPIGLLLCLALNSGGYSTDIIMNAMLATAVVSLLMMLAGTIFPDFFKSLGRTLFFSLLALIIVELVMMFLGFYSGIVDWIAVGIFSLYIGFDWARANEVTPTIDNAIDVCVELYLDIINLFLRILSILAKSDD